MSVPLHAETCPHCGKSQRPGSKFCTTCGFDLTSVPAPTPGSGQDDTRTIPEPPSPPPPAPPVDDRYRSAPAPGLDPVTTPRPPQSLQRSLVDIHSGYRSGRLAHEVPDELASSQVTMRVIRPHLVRFLLFLALWLITGVFSLLLGFISAGASLANSLSGESSGSGVGGAFGFAGILNLVIGLAWLVSFFLPVREPIAEYGILLEGRAGTAPTVFGWITRTIQERRTRFQIGDAYSGGQHLLTLKDGREMAAVVVRNYGSDLYVGWTMWRARSTFMLLVHIVRDLFEVMQGGAYAADIRLATTRAMRELVHSVTREGVQVAILET